jgi:hypothetical protein
MKIFPLFCAILGLLIQSSAYAADPRFGELARCFKGFQRFAFDDRSDLRSVDENTFILPLSELAAQTDVSARFMELGPEGAKVFTVPARAETSHGKTGYSYYIVTESKDFEGDALFSYSAETGMFPPVPPSVTCSSKVKGFDFSKQCDERRGASVGPMKLKNAISGLRKPIQKITQTWDAKHLENVKRVVMSDLADNFIREMNRVSSRVLAGAPGGRDELTRIQKRLREFAKRAEGIQVGTQDAIVSLESCKQLSQGWLTQAAATRVAQLKEFNQEVQSGMAPVLEKIKTAMEDQNRREENSGTIGELNRTVARLSELSRLINTKHGLTSPEKQEVYDRIESLKRDIELLEIDYLNARQSTSGGAFPN